MLDAGDPCPDFDLPLAGGGTASLGDYSGHHLVLYTYPRADTPGCTTQAQDFSAVLRDLRASGVDVLGVSKDPVAKLEKFAAKRELSVPLASDADSDLCERLGVWKEKSMYGKTFMGIERSTFLVGPDGTVLEVWRKVRPKGHVEAVRDALGRHRA